MAQVVIVGAGLTGLCVAYHLEQNGFYDFKIFEKNSHAGGLLKSYKQDGFTFDFTGHLLHINNPDFLKFIKTISDISNFNLLNRNSAIYIQEKTTPYPFQMNLNGLPCQMVLESICGFINRKKNIKHPKTFYEWVLKYFGQGMGKYFFFPYNQKILSYDIKKITPSWTGRFIPKTNLKAILQSTLCETIAKDIGYNNQFYYPKSDGIEFLINQILKNLKSTIYTEHNAIFVDSKKKFILFENGYQENFQFLINTAPLDELLKIIQEQSNSAIKKAIPNLLCNSVINFNLGFNKEKLSDKHWIYFPEKNYQFYRIGFWNNINKTSTPPNCSAIYGELSYLPYTKTEKQIKNLTNKAITQALKVLNLKECNIVTQNILTISHAYVICNFWREKNLKKLLNKLKELSIYSVGRYGEWKYASMQEAFLDGKNTAQEILEILKKRKSTNIIPAIKYIEKKETSIKQKQF